MMVTFHMVFLLTFKRFLIHNILLNKLCHYRICGLANKCFESYLVDRKQFVLINGYASIISNITCGVLQGSVLGPALFLVYI